MKHILVLFFAGAMLLVFMSSSCEEDISMPDPPVIVDIDPPALNPGLTFSGGPYFTGCPFNASGTALAGATIRYEISDGTSRGGSSPELAFDVPGTYTITLVATLDGRSEEVTRSVTVVEQMTSSETYQQNNGYTRAHKLYPLPDGSFISYGDYCRTSGTNGVCILQGFLLQWHNADGSLRTKRAYSNAAAGFRARAITVASDGKVVVAYERVTPDNSLPVRLCLLKTGEVGSADWITTKESSWDYAPRAVLQTSDGRFVVGGYAKRRSDGIARAGMYWFSETGTDNDNVPFGPTNASSRIERLVEKGPGEVIGLMVHANRLHLANSLNNSIADLGASFPVTAGLIGISDGRAISVSSAGSGIQIILLAPSGAVLSSDVIAMHGVVLYDALLLDNGNLLVSGKKTTDNITRGYLAEVTVRGVLMWEKDRRIYSRLRGIALTDDCGILATGYTLPPGSNRSNDHAYLVKMKPKGEL